MPNYDDFCAAIQKQCLPGVWSKGVSLSRAGALIQDSATDEEIIFRVKLTDRPISPKVSLWPLDEDWFCTCEDKNEVCAHIAAASIALKTGYVGEKSSAPSSTEIQYFFTSASDTLELDRRVHHGNQTEPLTQTLIALSGGISSGRLPWPQLAATQEEFIVDAIVGQPRKFKPDPAELEKILRALAGNSRVFLDGQPVLVSSAPVKSWIKVMGEGRGHRLCEALTESVDRRFSNGAVFSGGKLRPFEPLPLSAEERVQLSPPGKFYPETETRKLFTEVIPGLEARVTVERLGSNLPKAERVPARIEIELSVNDGSLEIIPRIKYDSSLAIRDEEQERILAREMQATHQLGIGIPTRLQGIDAVAMVDKLSSAGLSLNGPGLQLFRIVGELRPSIDIADNGNDFSASFNVGNGAAAASAVLAAWRENAGLVPLFEGGWARVPSNWLALHADTLERLLDNHAQKTGTRGKFPPQFLPDLITLAEASECKIPSALSALRDKLETLTQIPEAPLPSDLRADLRPYQRAGVNWICFLRDAGLGALLADDMGLGKTLQALCAIRGRTLVIAPTSVLHAWATQLREFRPDLSFDLYHGQNRRLNSKAAVTLTTYGVLRSERDTLATESWDMIILDEAQTIKNPDSQVARAAHALKGGFRLAMTGTPIENRVDDLWSQFEFLAPGFLGPRDEWKGAANDPHQTAALSRRIKPFILRRLKKDVAPELPPRIEAVLECELSTEERSFYQALLAASRADVLAKLNTGEKGSIFAALEALLRLRQACCDPALVPGHPPLLSGGPSSKVELLMSSLELSIGLGHRALVFSQWTSLLDRIEPALHEREISFSRLDGTTSNRSDVVERFQKSDGASVLLISLKAGGVGLTLTAADHVYLMDPWWNPATEDQAADRAHRIGQKNTVFIHRLVAADSIEERVLALQKSKTALAKAILGGDESGSTGGDPRLTRDELLELLR